MKQTTLGSRFKAKAVRQLDTDNNDPPADQIHEPLKLIKEGPAAPYITGQIREHLSSMLERYKSRSSAAMEMQRPINKRDAGEAMAGRLRKKTRRADADSDSECPEDDNLQQHDQHMLSAASLSNQAMSWLQLLVAYTDTSRMCHRDQVHMLRLIIRQHAIHEDHRPSQEAWKLLMTYALRFPRTTLRMYPAGHPHEGIPYAEECTKTFTCLEDFARPEWEQSQPAYGSNREAATHWLAPDFFVMLWHKAAALATRDTADQEALVQSHYGDVLLLILMVRQLAAELAPRLTAYQATGAEATLERLGAKASGKAGVSRRRSLATARKQLLLESHLWRLVVGMAKRGSQGEVARQITRMCLEIIAACAADGNVCRRSALPVQEMLQGAASMMLRLLLRLFGTLEASGHWGSALGSIRAHDDINMRAELDKIMVEAFSVSTSATMQRPEAKVALLRILQPLDTIRLLGMVVGNKRPMKPETKGKYQSMDEACQLAIDDTQGTGVTEGFITVKPVDVLEFLNDDLEYLQRTRKGPCPGEDYALFIAQIASASAAADLPHLEELLSVYNDLVEKMLKRHKNGDSPLAAEAIAELRGSLRILQAATQGQNG